MTFRVVPQALRDFSATLDGDASSVQTARSYLGSAAVLRQVGFAFQVIEGRHREAVQAIGESLDHLTDLFARSARELTASAEYYQRTDRQYAEQLDNSYPS